LSGRADSGELRLLDQGIDSAHHPRSLEGLFENGIAARALGFLFIEGFQQPGSKHHANMLETRLAFHKSAKLDARFTGQKNIGQNDIGIHVGQPRQGGVTVGKADHFKAFVPQYPLTHPLRMGAVVGQ
jgi:hypothetical protein